MCTSVLCKISVWHCVADVIFYFKEANIIEFCICKISNGRINGIKRSEK